MSVDLQKRQNALQVKAWIQTLSQQDLFELNRGDRTYAAMDPTWLDELQEEDRKRLLMMADWSTYSELLNALMEYRRGSLMVVSDQAREEWIQTGVGKISKWMYWSDRNKDYIRSTMDIVSHSVRIRYPLSTLRVATIGVVRAVSSLSFDLITPMVEELELFFYSERQVGVFEQREANVRNRWLEWYQEIQGCSYYASKRFKYQVAQSRSGPGLQGKIEAMRRIRSWRSYEMYLQRFTSSPFWSEEHLLRSIYADSMAEEDFVQYIRLATLGARSPYALREEMYQEIGNFFISTRDIRVIEGDDSLAICGEIVHEGTSLLMLKPVEVRPEKKKVPFSMDLICSMYFAVQVSDVEQVILRYYFDIEMKMHIRSEKGSLDSLWPHPWLHPVEASFNESESGEARFLVSAQRGKVEVVSEISPMMIYTVFSEAPVKRIVLCSGAITWEEVISDQPRKSVFIIDDRTFSFSIDEVTDNFFVIVETEKGFGVQRLGSFPDMTLPSTTICDKWMYRAPNQKKMHFPGKPRDISGVGVWVRQPKRRNFERVRRQVLYLNPPRWENQQEREEANGQWVLAPINIYHGVAGVWGRFANTIPQVMRAKYRFGDYSRRNSMENWSDNLQY